MDNFKEAKARLNGKYVAIDFTVFDTHDEFIARDILKYLNRPNSFNSNDLTACKALLDDISRVSRLMKKNIKYK